MRFCKNVHLWTWSMKHKNEKNKNGLSDWKNLTCFPPPLLGGMLEEISGPEGPPLLGFPVQLLQRISPWFPFFHIGEEFVLQTAQHGFKPSGIVNNQGATQRSTKPTLIFDGKIGQFWLTRYTMKQYRRKHMNWFGFCDRRALKSSCDKWLNIGQNRIYFSCKIYAIVNINVSLLSSSLWFSQCSLMVERHYRSGEKLQQHY